MNPQRQCFFLRLHAICLCVTNDTHWAFEALPMETETERERASGIVFDSMWFMYIKDCGQEVINRLHKAAHKKRTEKMAICEL